MNESVMRFKAEDYDEQVEALLDELIDAGTYAEYGDDTGYTRLTVSLVLGIADGEMAEVGEDGYVVLQTPPERIEAKVERARAAKARGESLAALIAAGMFD